MRGDLINVHFDTQLQTKGPVDGILFMTVSNRRCVSLFSPLLSCHRHEYSGMEPVTKSRYKILTDCLSLRVRPLYRYFS